MKIKNINKPIVIVAILFLAFFATVKLKLFIPVKSLDNSIRYWNSYLEAEQVFYGDWEFIELIAPDLPLPTRYSGFDENGAFRGPSFDKLLKTKVHFDKEGVFYNGILNEYEDKPVTYCISLCDFDDIAGYYLSESFEFLGDTFCVVSYLLPSHSYTNAALEVKNEIAISDINTLYIKDNNTMYASNGVLIFLMKRVKT